jgi:hypothetical protein
MQVVEKNEVILHFEHAGGIFIARNIKHISKVTINADESAHFFIDGVKLEFSVAIKADDFHKLIVDSMKDYEMEIYRQGFLQTTILMKIAGALFPGQPPAPGDTGKPPFLKQ